MSSSLWRAAIVVAATSVVVACGAGSGEGAAKGTIKIGSDMPACTSGGLTTQNGIKFAVDRKNAAGGGEGYTIQFQPFDDCRQGAYNQDDGVAHGRQMLADSKVLGIDRKSVV